MGLEDVLKAKEEGSKRLPWNTCSTEDFRNYYEMFHKGKTRIQVKKEDMRFYNAIKNRKIADDVYTSTFHGINQEDKEILVELVREEISKHKTGEITNFTLTEDLASLTRFSLDTLITCLKEGLPQDLFNYRHKKLLQQNCQKGLGKITKEERREIYANTLNKISADERSRIGKLGYANSMGKLTVEQRSKQAIKTYPATLGKRTKEQMREVGLRNYELTLKKLTKEQRVENLKKIGQSPTSIETKIIKALKENELYTNDSKIASYGQIYYCTAQNKRFFRFTNGKCKVPDFKIKGQNKVIEIHGRHWHNKDFCEKYGKPDYMWNSKRLIEEYARLGIECKVYWDHEIKNSKRLSEIVSEIKNWAEDNSKMNSKSQMIQTNYQGAIA